jgi:outer membrane protein W
MTDLKACGLSQQAQFGQLAVKVRFAKIDPNQNSDRQPL